MEDTNGNRITATHTGGLLTRLTHSSGQWLELAYNAADLIERLTDSEGGEVTYAHDGSDEHLVSASYDDGRTINYTYSAGEGAAREHALTGILQACGCGGNQYFTYDTRGRLAGTHREGGAEPVTYEYDSAGTITATNATGGAVRFLFDHRGLVGQIIDAEGHVTTNAYCSLHGRITAATDPLGRAYTYDYDSSGRLVRVTDPLGSATAYTYTGPPDRMASVTDANGNVLVYSYDARGNLLATRYADDTIERYTCDAVGNVETWTNRRGETVDFEHDAAGRIAAKIYPDSSRVDYTYDARGNLTSATDAAAMTVLEYYANDFLRRITYPDGKWIEFTYTATGQRASVADSLGSQVFYDYDALGRLEQLTRPGGEAIVQYAYDAVGRLERADLGSGVYTTYEYDPVGQLIHLVNYAPDDSVLSRFDYGYDALGQRTSMATLDGDWTYQYDDVGQLVGAQFDSINPGITDRDLTYEYDPLGNRIRTIVNGATTDYTTNDMNQYEAVGDVTYEYDDDGNLTAKITPTGTTTYAYDIENRLVRVETAADTWEYVYDALGSRVATVHNGTETNYLVDPIGLDTVIAEYDAAGDLITAYHCAYSRLIARSDDAVSTQYYTFDGLGSTAELSDASGTVLNDYAFDPFGLPLHVSEVVRNEFEFLGQWGITATGHGESFMRARYYDPVSGRFNAQDPLGLAAGDANLYRYVGNNPITHVDLTGTQGNPFICLFEDLLSEDEPPPDPFLEAMEDLLSSADPAPSMPPPPDPCDPPPPPAPSPLPPDPPPPPPPPGNGGTGSSGDAAGSGDPNEKTGPGGFGEAGYVAAGELLSYRVDFENEEAATAPAQFVVVTDQLDADLDFSSFEITEIGFGDHVIGVPDNMQHFETVVPMTYNDRYFEVHVNVGIDAATGKVTARFMSVDPTTDLPPDVLTGFLPPEDGTGRGMGYFCYTIHSKPDLPTGTEIRNVAVIQFDFGEIIATNQVDPHDPAQGTDPDRECPITIDSGAPTSAVEALAGTTHATEFIVSWAAGDEAGGSGVAGVDVHVSIDGGEYELWLDDTTAAAAEFLGDNGHTYAFYSVATDNVGHVEPKPLEGDEIVPDAVTAVVDDVPPEIAAIDMTRGALPGDVASITVTFTERLAEGGELTLALDNQTTGTDVVLPAPSFDDIRRTATWDLPSAAVPGGRYTATLSAAGVTDRSGNPLAAAHEWQFIVYLEGDANLDRDVSRDDFLLVRSRFGKTTDATWGDGDSDGDGDVDAFDYVALKRNVAKTVRAAADVEPVHGVCFGPYIGEGETAGDDLAEMQLRERLETVDSYTEWIRTYGSGDGLERLPYIARDLGLKTAMGTWIADYAVEPASDPQIANLLAAAENGVVDVAIVGNEDLHNGRTADEQAEAYLDYVRLELLKLAAGHPADRVPVTTDEPYQTLFQRDGEGAFVHQGVMDACDVLFVHAYPFWEGIDIEDAVAALHAWHDGLVEVAGDKPVWIAETGWPSDSDGPWGDAVPSPENAARYFQEFVTWAEVHDVPYLYFAAYDEPWKTSAPGGVGTHWGLWTSDGQMKPGMERAFGGERSGDVWTREAEIAFTTVPPIGSEDWLEGEVRFASPLTHDVAVYIRVDGNWWTKPSFDHPLTPTDLDGNWSCDIVTGGNDAQATEVAAFLWSASEGQPPVADGLPELPTELAEKAPASAFVERESILGSLEADMDPAPLDVLAIPSLGALPPPAA
jgi:RHS repeat-associated protein